MTNNCNSVNHTHLIFRSVKAAMEAWIDLDDESEEEEIIYISNVFQSTLHA